MRTAGLYIAALCTGSVVMRIFQSLVDQLFGPLTGGVAIAYILGSIAILWLTTVWVFSVLAVPRGAPLDVPRSEDPGTARRVGSVGPPREGERRRVVVLRQRPVRA